MLWRGLVRAIEAVWFGWCGGRATGGGDGIGCAGALVVVVVVVVVVMVV